MLSRRTLRTWIVAGWLASTLAPGTAAGAGADPATATAKQKADAQKKFDHGRELSAATRYPEALAEFQASFEIVASPNTHFSIARTLAYMGQLAEAYVEYGKTVAEAQAAAPKDKRYTQTAEASDAEQRELRPRLAFLVLSVEHGEGATVKVGERDVDQAAMRDAIPVTPGTVTVVVSNGGAEVARQSVTLAAADRKTVVLDAQAKAAPAPAPEVHEPPPAIVVDTSPGGLRTAAYIAGGVGVAGLATFAIFGSLEKSSYNELNDACHAGPCPPERADDVATGRSRQTIANVGLGVGIAGLAAGVVLFVVSAPPKAPTTARATVLVAPGFVGVGGSL
jgi:hypothetical protein